MMTNKKHNEILNEVCDEYELKIANLEVQIATLEVQIASLKERVELKSLPEKMTDKIKSASFTTYTYAPKNERDTNDTLPDNVLVYVNDILNNKVIKQEGNKCIVIDKNGEVSNGLTKQKCDKNYSYKLVRK